MSSVRVAPNTVLEVTDERRDMLCRPLAPSPLLAGQDRVDLHAGQMNPSLQGRRSR